jgi:cytochrome c-type biogenesis protein CcmH/NrfF
MTKARQQRLWAALAIVEAVLALGFLAATLHAQQSDRAKEIGGKLLCGVGTPKCDCKQILTQCNHVGCPNSAGMLKTLDAGVAKGDSETTIIQGFVEEFGTAVLSEPPKSGLNLVAWYLPSVTLFAGALLVVFVISRWRKRPVVAPVGPAAGAGISPELLARARAQASRETQD